MDDERNLTVKITTEASAAAAGLADAIGERCTKRDVVSAAVMHFATLPRVVQLCAIRGKTPDEVRAELRAQLAEYEKFAAAANGPETRGGNGGLEHAHQTAGNG